MVKLIGGSGHCRPAAAAAVGLLLLLVALMASNCVECIGTNDNECSLEQVDLYLAGLFDGPAADDEAGPSSRPPLELTDETGQILKQTIDEAIQVLQAVAVGQQSDENVEAAQASSSVSCHDILTVLGQLRQSVDSCETSLVEFLVNLRSSSSSVYLRQYARQRMEQCWRTYLAEAPGAIDKALGKSSSQVFDFIDQVAEAVHGRASGESPTTPTTTRAPRKKSNSIQIRENTEENRNGQTVEKNFNSPDYYLELEARRYSPEQLAKLKQIQFNSPDSERLLALALNSQFNKHLLATDGTLKVSKKLLLSKLRQWLRRNAEEPCQDVLARLESALADGSLYENQLGGPSLDAYLAGVKAYEPRLNYHLETRRICTQWVAAKEAIWKLLEAMR